jgi:hypothetical protein
MRVRRSAWSWCVCKIRVSRSLIILLMQKLVSYVSLSERD